MRKNLDFSRRPWSERQWMLENTWCPGCAEADLGMTDPVEYEEDDQVFLEGSCSKCGGRVVSEIHDKDS